MTKKILIFLLVMILALSCTVMLTACGTTTFTVTFDTDGGSAVASQTVAKDGTVTKPADPTKDGFEFAGWVDSNGDEFSFSTAITADTTITATWTEETVTPDPVVSYKVTVDGEEQTVVSGEKAVEPTQPTKTDYTFAGWVDGNGDAFDFNTAITADTTVTSSWGVGTESQLSAALTAGDSVVSLTNDIELTNTVSITNSVVIEGNGFSISFAVSALSVGNDTSAVTVVINNVDFVATASMSYAVHSTFSSTLTLDGCSFTGSSVTTMLQIFDTELVVDNCEFVDFNQGISVQSTDTAASAGANRAKVTVTDTTFTNGQYGVFTSTYGQPSWIYVTSCQFDNVAVFVSNQNGNIVVTDSHFTVGTNDNADASFKNTDTDGYLVRFVGTNTFVGAVDFAGDYTNDGTFVFEVATAQELANAVAVGGEVKLCDDITCDVVVAEGVVVTIDLNGHTLTNSSSHTIVNNGTLTIKDSVGTGVVTVGTDNKGALQNNVGGVVVLEGGTLTRVDESGNTWYVIKNEGTLTINGGSVVNTDTTSSNIANGWYNSSDVNGNVATLTINGGTISGGLNSLKNDEGGVCTINGGTFDNTTQHAVMNWNIMTINGGTFTTPAGFVDIYSAAYVSTSIGQLTFGADFDIAEVSLWVDSSYGATTVFVASDAQSDVVTANAKFTGSNGNTITVVE